MAQEKIPEEKLAGVTGGGHGGGYHPIEGEGAKWKCSKFQDYETFKIHFDEAFQNTCNYFQYKPIYQDYPPNCIFCANAIEF